MDLLLGASLLCPTTFFFILCNPFTEIKYHLCVRTIFKVWLDATMRWLPNISFTSSQSASSSASFKSPGGESPPGRKSTEVPAGAWRLGRIGRFTRHRKLRNFTNRDTPGCAPEERFAQLVLSPSHAEFSTAATGRSPTAPSAKPQPLPLPEFGIFRRKEGPSSDDVDFPLPSPKTGPNRAVEERDKDRASSSSPIRR
jgi:hypothetical protein